MIYSTLSSRRVATKRLGMAPLEKSCLQRLENKGTWTSTFCKDDLEAYSLHSLLNAVGASRESANTVLLRLSRDERAMLRAMGARLPGEHATSPAKRARLA